MHIQLNFKTQCLRNPTAALRSKPAQCVEEVLRLGHGGQDTLDDQPKPKLRSFVAGSRGGCMTHLVRKVFISIKEFVGRAGLLWFITRSSVE